MIEKYFMSQKTWNILMTFLLDRTYAGCPIEIDDSISYGAVEHRFIHNKCT